ncbi:MAG: GLUG motif-containing protein, partial [Cruoricaptor ignavus]|nr:GLUG motif-containing protein [Cruoricaptor ignavus]
FFAFLATVVSLWFSAQKYDKIPLIEDVQPYNKTFSIQPYADFPDTEWADFADTSWYNSTDTEFTINNAEELAGLSKLVSAGNSMQGKTFTLSANIDLGAHLWSPIGRNVQTPFSGSFDGNEKTISNLYINKSESDFVGLFGQFFNASLKNLTIDNAIVNGRDTVGTFVGNLSTNSTIENCHAKNTKVAADDGRGYNAGGLVGAAITESEILNCSAEGEVSGHHQIGGLIGSPWDKVKISKSYFIGKVTGQNLVGGLVGFSTFAFGNNREVEVNHCFAKAVIRGVYKIGGLYGYLQMGIVRNSYSASLVAGIEDAGSFVGGFTFGTIHNSFFDSSLSSLPAIGNIDGPPSQPETTGLTTENMKSNILLDALNANEPSPIWKLDASENDGYPSLIIEQLSTITHQLKNEVKIYPTLVINTIHITSEDRKGTYKILDFSGRIVKTGVVENSTLEVSDLSRGNYILQIQTKQNISNHRFIKK